MTTADRGMNGRYEKQSGAMHLSSPNEARDEEKTMSRAATKNRRRAGDPFALLA